MSSVTASGTAAPVVLAYGVVSSEQTYRQFQRRVDRLCFLIVATDTPASEINTERHHLRTEAERLFPEKIDLFDMIYESRFRRLMAQFRGGTSHAPTDR